MSGKHTFVSDSFDRRAYLRIFRHGCHGIKYRLAYSQEGATPFPDRKAAAFSAARAAAVIMRRLEPVEAPSA